MSNQETINEFVAAIDFAIDECCGDGISFLEAWREGNLVEFENDFHFKVPDELKNLGKPLPLSKQNTTVTITYSNGATQTFQASDALEEEISDGNIFSVSTANPDLPGPDVSKMYSGNPMTALGHMMTMMKNASDLPESDENKTVIVEVVAACVQLLTDEISSYGSGVVVDTVVDTDQYRCAMCQGIFDHGWSDENAKKEAEEKGIDTDDAAIICDDCYKKTPWCENALFDVVTLPPIASDNVTHVRADDNLMRFDCPVIGRSCDHYSYATDNNNEVAISHCCHPENSNKDEGNCTSFLCPLCTEGG
jgi:hypothetical protein